MYIQNVQYCRIGSFDTNLHTASSLCVNVNLVFGCVLRRTMQINIHGFLALSVFFSSVSTFCGYCKFEIVQSIQLEAYGCIGGLLW